MRILHTADWHLGRALEGRDRFYEQEEFADEICEIAEDQNAHLVVIAGDVYDTANPQARAEELFYRTLGRLSGFGKRAVLAIAGNHDSPDRLCAARNLVERYGIALSGKPRQEFSPARAQLGRVRWKPLLPGAAELSVEGCDHPLEIVSLPYVSETRLGELFSKDPDRADTAYVERVASLVASYPRANPALPRILVSHLFAQEGRVSESERPIAVGGAFAVSAHSLAEGFDYVALGHLHRPQSIEAAVAVRYAGSPLSYSFSEAGQAKSVSIVDLEPGKPAKVSEIFLRSGRPLVRWVANEGLSQVHNWISDGRDLDAWIDLEVHVPEMLGIGDIKGLREARPGFVSIRAVFPETETIAAHERSSLPLRELFRQFHLKHRNAEPSDALTDLFMQLITEDPEQEEGSEE